MPLLPNETLNKRYRIVSLLAQGLYGAVYRTWDVVEGGDFVVKEYLNASTDIQKRFRAEARRLNQLNHPQLPTVRDHFALDGIGQYLVTDYIPGIDLQSLLTQYGMLPSDLIVAWLQSACEPLAYLHQQKQLHLNIKPANIRITPTGEVFLVDSGLPGLGVRPHTDGYGAPEQQAQIDVTHASDIYSLGATLYTLLTGIVPPKALSRESGLADLKPAREVNPDIPPYLSLVAGRAMSIPPDTRYETAVAFAQALNRPHSAPTPLTIPADEPRRNQTAVMPTIPPPPQLPPNQRRRMEQRTIFALSSLLVLILIIAGAFTFFNVRPSGDVTEAEATATIESAVVAALTALAPTITPIPPPTQPPTPAPEPILTETGMRMLYVPGGVFRMGDDEGETDEQPSRIIRVNAFYIDETEVTNNQYAACVEAGACDPPDRANATYHPAYYGDAAYNDYPVIFVSWYDADTYCQWRGARLPSEAEWEKAAGFDPEQAIKLRYPWGDAFDGTKLNYCDGRCPADDKDATTDDGHQDTAPVGSYSDGRSPVGLYDMSGNVMEWVNDWYDPRYYREDIDINPRGPTEGEFKALRGGSWLSSVEDLPLTTRGSFDPAVTRANLGFRCAMDAP